MANKSDPVGDIYQKLSHWLEDVKQHEVTQLVDFVEQAKQLAIAAESLPSERVSQFVDNFRYDLTEFGKQWQKDSEHSVYLGVLNETWWSTLAKMTDTTQIEWHELSDDFAHDGIYHSGDIIGFGELECCHCHEKVMITHRSEVVDCLSCGKKKFVRHSLSP